MRKTIVAGALLLAGFTVTSTGASAQYYGYGSPSYRYNEAIKERNYAIAQNRKERNYAAAQYYKDRAYNQGLRYKYGYGRGYGYYNPYGY